MTGVDMDYPTFVAPLWYKNPWLLGACLLVALVMVVRAWLNPDPRRLFNDHVHFISATLGMGKTALAAHWVAAVLRPPSAFVLFLLRTMRKVPKPLPVVYSTFVLTGATPLDLTSGKWPTTRGAKIVIDEYLLLESNDLIPMEWLSKGLTLARQLGQQVAVISQSSRLPSRHKKFQGTIGLYMTMKGVSFGKLGRLVIVKRAQEPFIRRPKGFKADGQKTSFVWVPGSVFASYTSRMIFGYTVDLDGRWLDVLDGENMAAEQLEQAVSAAHAPTVPEGGRRGARAVGKPRRVHRVKSAV